MDARTRRLVEGPPTRLLVSLAAPNAIAFLIQSVVSLAEVWFVGRLGIEALAGIALVFPGLMLTQAMSGGAFGGGVASAVARALGAGSRERADALIWHVLVIAAAGALFFLIGFLLFGRMLLVALGGSGDVLEAALDYSLVLFGGGVSIWLMGTVSAIYRGTGNMQFPAFLMIGTALVQVPLSATLILGLGGAPQLGITGAAISVVVSSTLSSAIMIWRLTGDSQTVRLHLGSLKLQRALFADIMGVAGPATLSPLLTIGTVLALTALVGSFGEAALAGYGIGSRIEFLLIPLVFGLGAAMTSLVGVAMGGGLVDRAERIGFTGGAMAMGLAGTVGILLAIFPGAWIPAFTDDPAAIDTATRYIRIVGPFFAFQGLGLSLYFACQGAGAMFWPILATVVRIALAVGGALLLTGPLGWDLDGIFVSAAVAMLVFGLMIAAAVRLGAWRR